MKADNSIIIYVINSENVILNLFCLLFLPAWQDRPHHLHISNQRTFTINDGFEPLGGVKTRINFAAFQLTYLSWFCQLRQYRNLTFLRSAQ